MAENMQIPFGFYFFLHCPFSEQITSINVSGGAGKEMYKSELFIFIFGAFSDSNLSTSHVSLKAQFVIPHLYTVS